MNRLLTSTSLFLAACLFTSAVAVAQTGNTAINNGIVSVTWNAAEKTITLEQLDLSGVFATMALPQGETVAVTQVSAPAGFRGQPVQGNALTVRGANGDVEAIFTLFPRNPFVQVTRVLNERMFAEGHVRDLPFPQIELQMPTENLVTLGTAGLRAVDGHRGSYMFLAAANPANRNGVVTGWVTSDRGSGVIFSGKNDAGKAVIRPVLEYGRLLPPRNFNNAEQTATETLVIGWFDDARLGLERYAQQVARAYQIQLINPPPAGFCTWYADGGFGRAANENSIRVLTDFAVEHLVPFGFNFVQIDDGWQDGVRFANSGPARLFRQVYRGTGEIRGRATYPSGMRGAADHIRSKEMMAGIWILPFSATPEDGYWDESFFVRSGITEEVNAQGVSARFPFRGPFLHVEGEPYRTRWTGVSLDMTKPAVREYLRDTIALMANEWNFNYFKLDGFNAALGVENIYQTPHGEYRADDLGEPIFYNPEITPVTAHRLGLEAVREGAGPDAFILGCNISQNMRSMGASYGLVDAMRIGPDNGSSWNTLLRGPWHGSNRYFYNGRVWWNDPDPVYVRNSMPLAHAILNASWVSISGQLYVSSDGLPNLSEERIDILRRTLRPHGLTSVRPVDFFCEDFPRIWHLTTRPGTAQPGIGQPGTGGFGGGRPGGAGAGMGAARPAFDIVAFYNWDNTHSVTIETTPSWIGLPEATEYAAFDYWGNEFFGTFSDTLTVELPPGSCLVLAIQPIQTHPILLSTSQHVTQGIVDVVSVSWNEETRTLSGVSRVIANDPYELRIYCPTEMEIIRKTFLPTESSDSFEWSVHF